MEVLDQMLSDVKRFYEQATGAPYSREKLRGQPLGLPKDAEPEGFLYQQIAHLKNLLAARMSPFWSTTPQWMPVVDAYETGTTLVICVELPGIAREEATVSVGENLVVVKGERSFHAEETGCTVLARERFYGPFERWIPLPYRVKSEEVDAAFKDGILTIRLKKADVTTDGTRKVEIN